MNGPAEFTDPPRFPEGTPEYAAYAAQLGPELAKFAAGEPPYGHEQATDLPHEPFVQCLRDDPHDEHDWPNIFKGGVSRCIGRADYSGPQPRTLGEQIDALLAQVPDDPMSADDVAAVTDKQRGWESSIRAMCALYAAVDEASDTQEHRGALGAVVAMLEVTAIPIDELQIMMAIAVGFLVHPEGRS